MIPWSRLPQDLQKSILALALMTGAATVEGCCAPLVCDPPPPPKTAPPPPSTPLICDPAPPPSIADPSSSKTITPTLSLSRTPTRSQTPVIYDPPPPPRTATLPPQPPIICDPAPPPSPTRSLMSQGPLSEPLYDESASQVRLPLQEIRTVDIVWDDALILSAETPWPGASFRWTATGGNLIHDGDTVRWLPPAIPGRYFVQLVADWGYEGLAIDALSLTVGSDGSIFVS